MRGLVFINPGNPTGQCLTYEDLRELVKFAYEEKVVLMADEVYQPNVYQVGTCCWLALAGAGQVLEGVHAAGQGADGGGRGCWLPRTSLGACFCSLVRLAFTSLLSAE